MDIFQHRTAVQQDLAAAACGDIGDLLHAVDAAGERGDDDTATAFREDVAERLADIFFREGVPFALHVGRIGQECQNTGFTIAGQTCQVGQLAVYRSVVDLEIAGVNDDPFRAGYRQSAAVNDRVGHAQELDLKRADCHGFTRYNGYQLNCAVQLVLLQLGGDEAECQGGTVDRNIQLLQHKREGPDMVFVTMRQADSPDLF